MVMWTIGEPNSKSRTKITQTYYSHVLKTIELTARLILE
jgi:hypothetical protein